MSIQPWIPYAKHNIRGITTWMPALASAVTAPAILLLSLPLIVLGVVTMTLAIWILVLRVLLVYADLAMALSRAWLFPKSLPKSNHTPRRPTKGPSPQSKRASRSSSVGSDLVMRAPAKNFSQVSLAGSVANRDYEGVGGWRLAGDKDEEALWININSGSDPAHPLSRRHQRSFTVSSLAPGSTLSPEFVRTPLSTRPSTTGAARRRSSGTASPESYFTMPFSRSSAALDSAERHFNGHSRRRSSSGKGSTASLNMAKQV